MQIAAADVSGSGGQHLQPPPPPTSDSRLLCACVCVRRSLSEGLVIFKIRICLHCWQLYEELKEICACVHVHVYVCVVCFCGGLTDNLGSRVCSEPLLTGSSAVISFYSS